MPLQLRRGNTAERLSIVPLPGEPILDTDLNTIFIGNGVTAGGIATTITSEDAMDIIGQMFVNGQHDGIEFFYGTTQDLANRIDVRLNLANYDGELAASAFRGSLFADDSSLIINSATKAINATSLTVNNIDADSISVGSLIVNDIKGSIFGDDSTLLVNAVDSAINLDGTVKGNIIPNTNETYDIGSLGSRFKDIYLSGTSIFLGNATITATGTSVNLPTGSTVGGVPIGSGGGDGVIQGSDYNINIVGDDSTILVNSSTKLFTGNLTGNVQGNITGDVYASNGSSLVLDAGTDGTDATFTGAVNGTLTGNVVTSTITSSDSSAITVIPAVIMNSNLTVENEIITNEISVATLGASQILASNITAASVTGAVNGTFTGSVTGDVTGSVLKVDTTIIVDSNSGNITASEITATGVDIRAEADIPEYFTSRINAGGTPVTLNDTYFRIAGRAWTGTNYIVGSRILSTVNGAVGPTSLPSSLDFQVYDDSFGDLFTYFSIAGGATGRVESYKPFALFDEGYDASKTLFGLYQYHDTADAVNTVFARTRGTGITQTAVQNGDDIADITFLGGHGSGYGLAASISVIVDNNVTSTYIPGKISIRTGDGVTGTYERLSIDHLGVTTITGSLNVAGSANISGGVVTDLIGGVFSGTSAMLIDGIDGSMMMANINVKGETGNFPLDTGTPDSWLEVTVNGATKYIPLYD